MLEVHCIKDPQLAYQRATCFLCYIMVGKIVEVVAFALNKMWRVCPKACLLFCYTLKSTSTVWNSQTNKNNKDEHRKATRQKSFLST